MTELIAVVLFALPSSLVFGLGVFLCCAGVCASVAGMYVDSRARGKFYLRAGVSAVLAGLIMILFPAYPFIAIWLLYLWIFIALVWCHGWLAAWLYS